MSDLIRKFKELKSFLKEKENELSEAKGELKAIQQQCREEFKTTSIEELDKLQKKYQKNAGQLEENLEALENELEELLKKIEKD